jgi:hypothetical protein
MSQLTKTYNDILRTLKNGGEWNGEWAGPVASVPMMFNVVRDANDKKRIGFIARLDDRTVAGIAPTVQHAIDTINSKAVSKLSTADAETAKRLEAALQTQPTKRSGANGGTSVHAKIDIDGVSACATIRWMGVQGWTAQLIRGILDALELPEKPANHTVQVMLYRVKKGRQIDNLQIPDALQKRLATLRARVEKTITAEEKARKSEKPAAKPEKKTKTPAAAPVAKSKQAAKPKAATPAKKPAKPAAKKPAAKKTA